MKAFLLAAGEGTRLRPYTATVPKCLVPVHDRPLLAIWIDLLEQHGITEVLINTHYLARAVVHFVEHYQAQTKLNLITAFEPTLLGSGGTLWTHRQWVKDADPFMIAYADNLTDANLGRMIAFHNQTRESGGILTMALFKAPDPTACGIAVMDPTHKIIKFVEKPARPESEWANAGIYVASPEIFDYFPPYNENQDAQTLDHGHHVLPRIIGRTFGWPIDAYLRDIGTVASYHQALEEWPANRS